MLVNRGVLGESKLLGVVVMGVVVIWMLQGLCLGVEVGWKLKGWAMGEFAWGFEASLKFVVCVVYNFWACANAC